MHANSSSTHRSATLATFISEPDHGIAGLSRYLKEGSASAPHLNFHETTDRDGLDIMNLPAALEPTDLRRQISDDETFRDLIANRRCFSETAVQLPLSPPGRRSSRQFDDEFDLSPGFRSFRHDDAAEDLANRCFRSIDNDDDDLSFLQAPFSQSAERKQVYDGIDEDMFSEDDDIDSDVASLAGADHRAGPAGNKSDATTTLPNEFSSLAERLPTVSFPTKKSKEAATKDRDPKPVCRQSSFSSSKSFTMLPVGAATAPGTGDTAARRTSLSATNKEKSTRSQKKDKKAESVKRTKSSPSPFSFQKQQSQDSVTSLTASMTSFMLLPDDEEEAPLPNCLRGTSDGMSVSTGTSQRSPCSFQDMVDTIMSYNSKQHYQEELKSEQRLLELERHQLGRERRLLDKERKRLLQAKKQRRSNTAAVTVTAAAIAAAEEATRLESDLLQGTVHHAPISADARASNNDCTGTPAEDAATQQPRRRDKPKRSKSGGKRKKKHSNPDASTPTGKLLRLTESQRIERAQRTFRWYARLGMPSREEFRGRIQAGPVLDAQVTVADIDLLPWNRSGIVVNVAKFHRMVGIVVTPERQQQATRSSRARASRRLST